MKCLRMFLWLTFITGIVYPFTVYIIAQTTMQDKAEGSMIGKVGSKLIAQKFVSDRYFWPRPSANDYNGLSSGGSNLGPISPQLKKAVAERKARFKEEDVPAELLYASGSGLDPHISPKTAYFQAERIAKARNIDPLVVNALIKKYTVHSTFGPQCCNVLEMNLALDRIK